MDMLSQNKTKSSRKSSKAGGDGSDFVRSVSAQASTKTGTADDKINALFF